MSMNYDVHEHLVIDRSKAGKAAKDMLRILDRQLWALVTLQRDGEMRGFMLSVVLDGDSSRMTDKRPNLALRKIQELRGLIRYADKLEVVLSFNSVWRPYYSEYEEILPTALTELAEKLSDEELEGIFYSSWMRIMDTGARGTLVAYGRRGETFCRGPVRPVRIDTLPDGQWFELNDTVYMEVDSLSPEELDRTEAACLKLMSFGEYNQLIVKDGEIQFGLYNVTLTGQRDWEKLTEGIVELMNAAEHVNDYMFTTIGFVDLSGPDARLVETRVANCCFIMGDEQMTLQTFAYIAGTDEVSRPQFEENEAEDDFYDPENSGLRIYEIPPAR